MLDRLRAKAPAAGVAVEGRVHLGRMESLDLARRYLTIIVPSSSFQLLLDPAHAAAAMGRFFVHLEPAGVLAMPFILMDEPYEEHWAREATLPDGSIVRRTATAIFDPVIGIEATIDRYDVLRDGVPVRSETFERPRATRGYDRRQAAASFIEAGFVDVEWGADFTWEDREPESVFTIIGRRPA